MRRVAIAVPLVAVAVIVSPASAVPIHVHEKVPVVREVPTTKVVANDPVLTTKLVRDTKIVETTIHVAPKDADDDGIADHEDTCIGYCAPPREAVAVPSTDPAAIETPTYTDPAAPTYSAGGCPSYMSGEASSPTAVNPTSGASGCFQVIPSTADAMGSACDDVNAPSCVAAICAAQGNDAWDAADPC